jgi:hypothetical protein
MVKRASKKCEKDSRKTEKKHNKAEWNRIGDLLSQSNVHIYQTTHVSQGEFDASPKAVGGRTSFDLELRTAIDGFFSFNIYEQDVFLRSSSKHGHQLYFWLEHKSKEWFLIDSATVSGGGQKTVTSIYSKLLGCGDKLCEYEEHFGIPFSDRELRNWYESGASLRIKFHGRITGNGFIATIPNAIVNGYVNAVNEHFPIVDQSLITPVVEEFERQRQLVPFVAPDCSI